MNHLRFSQQQNEITTSNQSKPDEIKKRSDDKYQKPGEACAGLGPNGFLIQANRSGPGRPATPGHCSQHTSGHQAQGIG
jgi:hypothetical protein